MAQWLQTPAGRYLLAWEQAHLDHAVADIFGFHAVQLGLPQLDGLAANRMPHRWVVDQDEPLARLPSQDGELGLPQAAVHLRCEFDALPFDSQSLDLVVLPHTLEFARESHRTLAEVERVLRPEGRVVIVGFNPASLWGLRRHTGARADDTRVPLLPPTRDMIGYRRLRDWLRLLSFDVEAGRFGCYRPPVRTARWLERCAWMERVGGRWWPVFGAVYALTAVKRVRGMRLVGLAKTQRVKPKKTPAVATPQHRYQDPH